MKKFILAPIIALAAIIATAIPASAVDVGPSGFTCQFGCSVITADGKPALRLELSTGYAQTDKFWGIIQTKNGSPISVCVTYRGQSGQGAVTVYGEDWQVSLPYQGTTGFITNCAWVVNPWGSGGWVQIYSNAIGGANTLVRNVSIN